MMLALHWRSCCAQVSAVQLTHLADLLVLAAPLPQRGPVAPVPAVAVGAAQVARTLAVRPTLLSLAEYWTIDNLPRQVLAATTVICYCL